MTRNSLLSEAEKNISVATQRIALEIEHSNHVAITVSKIMALSQETALFGKRNESIDFSKKILKKYPQFTGSYFAYEPNADLNDEIFLQNSENRHNSIDKNGRFLPYWYIFESEITLSPLKDMETSLYYQGTKDKYYSNEKDKSNLTEPYFYEGKMILEYTTPIVINNKFMGIAGVDKALVDVNNYIAKLKPYKNSNYVLISKKGNVIASDMNLGTKDTLEKELLKKKALNKDVDVTKVNRYMITFNILDTDYAKILNNFHKMKSDRRLITVNDTLTNEAYYYNGYKIKTGDWTLIMRVSESEITAPINSSLKRISIFLILIFLIIIFMSISLSNRIVEVIDLIIEASSKVAKGDFKITLPDFSIYEVNLLKKSMSRTALILKTSRDNLEKRVIKRTAELEESLIQLKNTQSKLVETKKMACLGELVAGVAHEINTPVGISLTGVTFLLDETEIITKKYAKDDMSKEEFEEYLKTSKNIGGQINTNLVRTAKLVRSFKQIAIDQTHEEIRTFPLNSYIQEVLISISNITKKINIKVIVECDKNIKINSYPGAFSQIITNLIINSINHAFGKKEKGIINISVIQEGNGLKLIFKDNGKGISTENIEKIFEPFFTTNREYGGSGLGLSIIYNIITSKLKGTITCDSKIEEGVEFTIYIPSLHS